MEYTKENVKDVIEGKGNAEGVPMLYDLWIYPEVFEHPEETEAFLKTVPKAVEHVFLNMPPLLQSEKDDLTYCWDWKNQRTLEKQGIDSQVLIQEWEDAEDMYACFPNSEYKHMIPDFRPAEDRYLLARWWYCLFERHWSLRGMENALTDFYLYPEEVHTLYQKLTDFYMRAMERAREELRTDGIFVSDDIGTQRGPFFSLEIFRTFFKPYYKQLIEKAHALGMHFWLHTCGDVELFLSDFIEIGLDVIHPIQKGTMDEKLIAEKYGKYICILAGLDVQHVIPFGTPEEVKEEVRHLINTFARKEGRFMLTMGNGATKDWSLANIRAMYEETKSYTGHNPK